MHTTRILTAADFAYARIDDGARVPVAFAELFPDWHERERVAVVSRTLEEGIAGTGATLLALATRFYDAQREKARARGGAFFDYPRHFALIGGPRSDVVHAAGGDRPFAEEPLRRSWGQLDVWPPTNWLVERPTATAMLARVYALQIDRLFWPAGLGAAPSAPTLTPLARKLLQARLKQVVLYGADSPDAAVSASPSARDLVAGALTALGVDGGADADRLRRVPVDEFLAAMESCFADETAAPA